MKRSPTPLRTLGLILFFAGVLLGLSLAGGLTWANLEADFYFGFGIEGDTSLRMACPLVMTAAETGQVSIVLQNPSDRLVEPLVQVDISGPIIGTTSREHIQVAAGTSQSASWPVDREDVAFGHLILAKVYQFAALSLPSADDTCGILVLDVPGLSGKQLYLLVLVASGLAAAIGYLLWAASYRTRQEAVPNETGGLLLLAGIVAVGILIGSLGWWMPGLLAVAASLLLTAILISRQVNAGR
jgi:hypothetical protein